MSDRVVERKARQARRDRAITRPELRLAPDGVTRRPGGSPVGPLIKEDPPELRAMIDAALAERERRP